MALSMEARRALDRWHMVVVHRPPILFLKVKQSSSRQYGDHRAKLFQSPVSYSTFLVFITAAARRIGKPRQKFARDEGISIKKRLVCVVGRYFISYKISS